MFSLQEIAIEIGKETSEKQEILNNSLKLSNLESLKQWHKMFFEYDTPASSKLVDIATSTVYPELWYITFYSFLNRLFATKRLNTHNKILEDTDEFDPDAQVRYDGEIKRYAQAVYARKNILKEIYVDKIANMIFFNHSELSKLVPFTLEFSPLLLELLPSIKTVLFNPTLTTRTQIDDEIENYVEILQTELTRVVKKMRFIKEIYTGEYSTYSSTALADEQLKIIRSVLEPETQEIDILAEEELRSIEPYLTNKDSKFLLAFDSLIQLKTIRENVNKYASSQSILPINIQESSVKRDSKSLAYYL
jgi:hypothetical protein